MAASVQGAAKHDKQKSAIGGIVLVETMLQSVQIVVTGGLAYYAAQIARQ